MTADTPAVYQPRTIAFVKSIATQVQSASVLIGVRPTAVFNAISEEVDDIFKEPSYKQFGNAYFDYKLMASVQAVTRPLNGYAK